METSQSLLFLFTLYLIENIHIFNFTDTFYSIIPSLGIETMGDLKIKKNGGHYLPYFKQKENFRLIKTIQGNIA